MFPPHWGELPSGQLELGSEERGEEEELVALFLTIFLLARMLFQCFRLLVGPGRGRPHSDALAPHQMVRP